MSDFKSMFRKAQANRGVGSSKAQLRKLIAQKKAVRPVTSKDESKTSPGSLEVAPASVGKTEHRGETLPTVEHARADKKRSREEGPSDAELMPPPPPRRPSAMDPQPPPHTASSEPKPPITSESPTCAAIEEPSEALPDDFFQQGADSVAAPPVQVSTVTRSKLGTVPEGFFEDKEADGMARGIKPRTKKDKEAEYLDFQREMEASMQDLAEREAVDAEDGARTREEVEAFEQELRFRLVSSLREKHKLSHQERKVKVEGVEGDECDQKPKKKRYKMDLPEVDSDEEWDSDDGDSLTDWRAKAV